MMQLKTPQPFKTVLKDAVLPPTGKEPVPLGSGMITRILGSGGMASVYEIWNQELEVFRAVKLMHPNCSTEALQRFQTEIKITAKMHHPNIVEIHGVGTWNDLPYIEMEKAEGVTLENLIHSRGALPIEVCISIGILVTRALDYAHNHRYMLYNKEYNGVIHRDLKPGNIMISTHEHLKLMDFGIARPADASFHTIDGTVVGTLQYLSPEQLEGLSLDIRTDIYSLGACLYEAACGNYAFPEANIQRLISDKSKNRFRPLTDYSAKFPERFVKIIHQCMNQDRKVRPQNALQLGSELEQLLRKLSSETPEAILTRYMEMQEYQKLEVVPVRRFSFKMAASGLLLIAAGVIGTILLLNIVLFSNKKGNKESFKPQVVMVDTTKSVKVKTTLAIDTISKKTQVQKQPVQVVRKSRDSSVKHSEMRPVVSKSRSILESLYSKYDTHDILQIMKSELAAGNAQVAVILYDSLPNAVAKGSEALVVKKRALKMVNKKLLASFLNGVTIQEGELLLEKAWLAFNSGRIESAEDYLNKALGAPRALISYESLTKDVFYLKALCATAKFDAHPDDNNWKSALEAWYNVKKEMRTQPSHSYFITADKEIVRIGEKFRSTR